MELKFSDYFSAGCSLLAFGEAIQARVRLRGEALQITKHLFADEHKVGVNCCGPGIGDSEDLVESEVILAAQNHIPNTVPFVFQKKMAGTITNIIRACGASSGEEFGEIKYLWFGETIPEVSGLLDGYVEPEAPQSIVFQKLQSRNIIFGTTGDLLTSIQPNEIIVSKNSGQFTSIGAALAYLQTLVDKAVIIRVYPGIYVEAETISLPNYTCLIGEGSAGNTTIVGRLETHAFNFVKNFHIIGSLHHDGDDSSSFSLVKDCMIKVIDGLGIKVCCGMGSLSVSHISVYAEVQGAVGVKIESGSFIASEMILQLPGGTGLDFDGGSGTLDIISIYYTGVAIVCSGSVVIKGTLINIVDSVVGIHFPARGTGEPKFCVNYLHIDRAQSDIVADAPCALELYSGHVDPEKIIKNVPIKLGGSFYSKQQNIIGQNHVHGSLTFMGESDPVTVSAVLEGGRTKFSIGERILSFASTSVISEILGGGGLPLKFVRAENFYWLPLNHAGPFEYSVAGQVEIEYLNDSTIIQGARIYHMGGSRKKKIIYPYGGSFITPGDADTSTPFVAKIRANIGITLGGEFFASGVAEKSFEWVESELQEFTFAANGITLLAVEYYSLFT